MSTERDYIVKESPRAKHVRLKLSLREGLVVVVPKGFDQGRIPRLLEGKKRWLEKARERIEIQRKFFEPAPSGALPERLTLRGIGEEWAIEYRATDSPRVAAVERRNNRLLVYGDTDGKEACEAALRRWLNRKAHEYLVPWLRRLAGENGFALNRILVKAQRTRWASCSRHQTISLNLKLLFIPENLIRYALFHELCHTMHLNHSQKFWALLRHHDPDYMDKDKKLRAAWRCLPAWLDGKRMRGERDYCRRPKE